MPEKTSYVEGAPCWPELTLDDIDAAKQFYAPLLGWTYQDKSMPTDVNGPEYTYTIAMCNGKQVAGLAPKMEGQEDVPHSWNVYLASSDIDEVASRIEQNDGKILAAPMDIPGQGRMLFALDPDGAPFGVWQGEELIGSELYNEPGALAWADVATRDVDRIDSFYRALFGYSAQQQIQSDDVYQYAQWKVGDENVAGRMLLTEDIADLPPHWTPYFAVADCDATCAMVKSSGGSVTSEPMDTPYGRMANVQDPWGGSFAICQLPAEGSM